MDTNIKYSIIIIFKNKTLELVRLLEELNLQTYKNFEVVLVSENNFNNETLTSYDLKFIKSSDPYPGKKRHLGLKNSSGSMICFIDDDAYPEKHWLENINNHRLKGFKILGGPAIDIISEKIIPKILSLFYKLKLIGGFPERYSKQKNKLVEDWPSVNFVIDKQIYLKTNGFDYKIWPGEDSLLCNDLVDNGYKINYFNNLIVYHKRRIDFFSHFKQLYGYSSTRGFFFKKKIKNSFKFKFLAPSCFVIYCLSLLFINSSYFYFPIVIYFLFNIFLHIEYFFRTRENFIVIFLSIFMTFINHCIYGIGFIIGLLKERDI